MIARYDTTLDHRAVVDCETTLLGGTFEGEETEVDYVLRQRCLSVVQGSVWC